MNSPLLSLALLVIRFALANFFFNVITFCFFLDLDSSQLSKINVTDLKISYDLRFISGNKRTFLYSKRVFAAYNKTLNLILFFATDPDGYGLWVDFRKLRPEETWQRNGLALCDYDKLKQIKARYDYTLPNTKSALRSHIRKIFWDYTDNFINR